MLSPPRAKGLGSNLPQLCTPQLDTARLPQRKSLPQPGPRKMLKETLSAVAWLCIFTVAFVSHPVWPQKPPKHKTPAELTVAGCCEEAKELKAQIANLSSLLSDLSRKQERDWVSVVMQVMELESNSKRMESRLTEAESKYSEMNNQMGIMQLQAAQTVTQTSAGKEDVSSRYSPPSPSHSRAPPVWSIASR